MTVTVAKHAGFCFGVRRATEAVEKLLAEGGTKVFTLGRLIHNDGYCASLAARGVTEIDADGLPSVFAAAERGEDVTVVIRAHGEVKSVLDRLGAFSAAHPNLHVFNGTCPFVEKVRRIAAENSGPGKRFYLLGTKDHPEVRGILSCADGGIVFSSAEELSRILEEDHAADTPEISVFAASQTTQKVTEWENSLKILKKVYAKPIFYDTICSVTDERQKEAADLAARSDAVIVIGSPSSSNTVKLYEVCRERCALTFLAENADELPTLPRSVIALSITAGASTPYSVIQEVKRKMAEQENFEAMLEDSLKTINTGEVVTGTITSISANEVHLDLGAKTTGVIAREKLTNDPAAKLTDLFKVGDTIRAKVIKVSDVDGIATLDKLRVDADANWERIVAACESKETLEGKVTEAVKGGVVISIDNVRVFIPARESGIPRDGDLSVLVGTTQKVKIIEVKQERKRAYASIRAILREERKAKQEQFWNELEEGKEFDGVVSSLTDYGAFVDLGCGVDGLVHVTELSWKRIHRPSDVVKVGDPLHVFVKSFDRERGRISLGYKTEEMNPWFQFTSKYAVGDVAHVRIVSIMSYGAFAELVPGVDGLIHISQLADHRVEKVEDVVSKDQEVDVKIINIDMDAKKVSLSIRALLEQPAAQEDIIEAAPAQEDAPVMYSTDNPEAFKDFQGEEKPSEQ